LTFTGLNRRYEGISGNIGGSRLYQDICGYKREIERIKGLGEDILKIVWIKKDI